MAVKLPVEAFLLAFRFLSIASLNRFGIGRKKPQFTLCRPEAASSSYNFDFCLSAAFNRLSR